MEQRKYFKHRITSLQHFYSQANEDSAVLDDKLLLSPYRQKNRKIIDAVQCQLKSKLKVKNSVVLPQEKNYSCYLNKPRFGSVVSELLAFGRALNGAKRKVRS